MSWLKSKSKNILLFTGLLCVCNGFAQQLSEWQKKHSGHNELIIKEAQSYDFSIHKNQLQILQDNYYESVILSEMGIHNNSESFSFSELVPLKKYEAYTVVHSKGKERKIPIQQVSDKNSNQSNIFYSGVKDRKLIFSNLEVGAKKVYSYQSEFLDPCLLHRFSFAGILPMEQSSFEIITDKNIEIGYKIFNDPNQKISFSKSERKGKNIYSWELHDVDPLVYESNNPGFLYIAPHIVFYIRSYVAGKEKIELLGNTEQLYKYYQNFIKELNQTEDANLKAITQELTKNLTSDKDKIQAIFYWVKDNIKYVAFENGYEGFIPREASLVNERRFGDCKDMSSIITEMAKYAAVPHVNLCWIGTRRIPYSYRDISTPSVDDHMIASVELDEEIIFLDATDRETRFGLPSSFIQGKEALISNGDSYKIVSVPIVEAQKNSIVEKLHVELNQNKLEGLGEIAIQGLARTNFLLDIGDASNKARFEAIKSLVLKGNNKFILKEYKEHNISDRDLPYQVDFVFELDNYVVEASGETYINLFLDKPFEKLTIEKNRKAKFEFDFLLKQQLEINLEIPKDKKVFSVPENISEDNHLLKYTIKYEVLDNKLILEFEIETKKILLDNSDFELWNQSVKELKSHYSEMAILINK